MTFEKLLKEKLNIQLLSLYNYALKASKRYKVYQIKKKTGGMRTIHHPAVELKLYQRFLVQNIFLYFPVHDKVFSYKEKTSIRDLALLHVNNRFLLRIDFKDFFPSIKSENIRDFLSINQSKLDCNLSEKDITIINMLVCRKNELTIGAPSSPILSNILLYDFDLVMNKMFSDSIVYSRYADDLYFSTNVPNILTEIPKQINEFLLTYYIKLKINNNKTIFTSKKHKRIITGLTITTENTISIGREKKQYIKGLMYKFRNKQIEESDLIYLKGYLSFIKSVDMTFFNLLEKKYGIDILYSSNDIPFKVKKESISIFSKSLYTRAIQCPKALWLDKYKKEVLTPLDTTAIARFETGNVVGDSACNLFPNGRKVPFTPDSFHVMVETTKEWMAEGLEYIYEATFLYEGILILVDVLKVTPKGLEIYEVKSSSSIKDIYLHDVSIQLYVLRQLGYNVLGSHIVHINSSYIRDDELDLNELFNIVDVSEEVDAFQEQIPQNLELYEKVLADRDNEPDIDIGSYCNKPYECDAKEYCWKVQRDIPDYSVFNIFNLGSKKQVELYEQGIVKIEDIPSGYPMTTIQKQKVQNWKDQETYIDKLKIKEFLEILTYPIYHLDFETFQEAIPKFKGLSPYEQIPFQYSLHIEHFDGTLEHKEFLAKDGIDPRYALAKRLVGDIPTNVTILVYNMNFEKDVNARLAENFPKFKDHLLAINENMKDLMFPFQKKYYVTPQMKGSYSIKYVLPSLVPEMADAYKNLNGIQNGGDAMNAYPKLSSMVPVEKERTRKALLAYCKLDTLAMVKVLESLKYL